jgi:hypothetical protein
MVRVADATGTPLDPPMMLLTEPIRARLALDRFAAAANTPRPGRVGGAAGALLRPLAFAAIRLAGRWRRR